MLRLKLDRFATYFFDAEGSFSAPSTALLESCQPARKGKKQRIKIGVPDGEYAVVAFQDLNSDGVLNYSDTGLPSEPIGFSTNPSLTEGIPSVETCLVDFNVEKKPVRVRLQQL